MPDPSHRPYKPMTIIRPNSKPAFWWLVPWAYACELHRAANAVKAYADKADRDILHQKAVIANLQADIGMLRQRIADQNDAIIRGTAITPDAQPYTE